MDSILTNQNVNDDRGLIFEYIVDDVGFKKKGAFAPFLLPGQGLDEADWGDSQELVDYQE